MLSVIGSKLLPDSRVSAKMKSPQPFRKANTATVMTADRLIGSTTRTSVFHSDAPSTRAACSTSLGRPSMNARSTRMLNGTP
jgi:hypothetical protein